MEQGLLNRKFSNIVLILPRLQQKHAIDTPLTIKLDGYLKQYISMYSGLVLFLTLTMIPEVSMTRNMGLCP